MKTFLNIKQEFPKNHPDRDDFISSYLIATPLNRKITQRGIMEQYASVNYLHYDSTMGKRARRSSKWKNNSFQSIN